MNIACFGCSWTAGIHYRIEDSYNNGFADTGENNWVRQLSKIMPYHNFYNFAFPGSSIIHSIYVLDQVKKNIPILFDKIIFQATTEGRFTYYNEPLNNTDFVILPRIKQLEDNYFYLDLTMNEVITVNYGTLGYKDHTGFFLAEAIYSCLNPRQTFQYEHRIYLDWLKDKVDLLFFHRKNHCFIEGILTIEDKLTAEEWNKFVIDEGGHFSLNGSKWEATYIKEHINKL
jgi:hypothetical protein